MKLGLVGRRLSHSFSKTYFESRFRKEGLRGYEYELYEIDSIDLLRTLVDREQLAGFNVTIPYKVDILRHLDALSPLASELGAVNTVSVERRGSRLFLTGHNTDAPAFLETLRPLVKEQHRNALILGTGGAAQAVAWALRQLEISYLFVSRNPLVVDHESPVADSKPYIADLEHFTTNGKTRSANSKPTGVTVGYDKIASLVNDHMLIVNATPVGMSPDTENSPWQHPEWLTPKHLCYDLIYNPSPSLFLQQAASQGATIRDGLAMLHRQADLAFNIWTGTSPSGEILSTQMPS